MKGKERVACIIVFLLAALMLQGVALVSPDVIRLHVIANSDSMPDQRSKELVRDRIIQEFGPLFASMNHLEAENWLQENIESIDQCAEKVLAEAGMEYGSAVAYGVTKYPTRLYGCQAFPAGRYKSVRVILGEGAGQNWWCLMFPPLCFVDGTVEAKAEPEAQEKVTVRFWILDKIKQLFKWLGGY